MILGETFLVVNWVWEEHTFIVRGQTVHSSYAQAGVYKVRPHTSLVHIYTTVWC